MLLNTLGTGANQVSNKRSSPANYLEIGNTHILVDCGSGTLLRLDKAGIFYKDIDIVFISHFHIDHISDLFAILWSFKWPNLGRKKDLTIIGPKGFQKFYQTYIEPIVFTKPFESFNIKIKEIKEKMKFNNFNVEIYNTKHTEESIAYKFIEDKKIIVISGDTDYDVGLINFCKNADVLLLECAYDNSNKVDGHLIPKKCGKIATRANVKKLILTHFYPISNEIRLKQTKKIFENTIMAKDLMEIKI